MRVEITVTMYSILKRCPLSFDPGGRNSLLVVFLAFVVSFSRFNEVHCFTATSEETWQRRREFPEGRHAHNRKVVVVARNPTTSSLSKFNLPEYKTSELISGQTDHMKDDLLQVKPDDFIRHSEHHAIKSLSALINTERKQMNKSVSNDFAADTSLPMREFKDESQRTKTLKDGDEVKISGREEKLDSSVGKKPSSIHEFNIQERKYLILNEGSSGDRQLDKREAGREPPRLAEKSALSTENLPTTNLSITNASSKGDEQISSSAVPKSTSTTLQTTTKPKSSSSSTPSTVQQHINTLPQASSRTSSTVHPQQRPKPSTVKKEIAQTHTSHVQKTEESPTTDAAVEESNASCDGAQCYASRLPYHWTTDASWALASMVFLISLLTFFVLYTGLWKKRNPMSYPLDSSVPPNPNPKINIADLLKTRLAMIPRHLRSKRQAHRKRMNGRRYEELPLHQANGTCNEEELDYFEDDDEDDLYLRDEHTV